MALSRPKAAVLNRRLDGSIEPGRASIPAIRPAACRAVSLGAGALATDPAVVQELALALQVTGPGSTCNLRVPARCRGREAVCSHPRPIPRLTARADSCQGHRRAAGKDRQACWMAGHTPR